MTKGIDKKYNNQIFLLFFLKKNYFVDWIRNL